MPENIQQRRDISSDLLRGFALWLVVLGHMIPSDSVLYFYINDFHMPLLFFLSGWWASRSFEKKLPPALLLGKAKRLIIPYISWSLVALIFNLFMQYRANGELMIADIAVRILLEANSVWFFPVLYAAFLLLSAIRLLEKKGRCWVAPIFFILSLLLPNTWFMLCKLKVLFPFFYLGYILRGKGLGLDSFERKPVVGILSGVLFIVLPLFFYSRERFVNYSYFAFEGTSVLHAVTDYLWYTTIALCGCYFAISILLPVLKKLWISNILASIGQQSMDIYGVHMFFVKLVALIWPAIILESELPALICQCIMSIIITLICWLLAKYVLRRIELYRILFEGDAR